MSNLVKGVIITVVILAVLMVVNIICNCAGVELNSTLTGVVSGICGMFAYDKVAAKKEN